MENIKYWIISLLVMIGLSFSNNLDNELSYNKIEINEEAINFDSDTDWNLWVAFDDDDDDEDSDDDSADDDADDDSEDDDSDDDADEDDDSDDEDDDANEDDSEEDSDEDDDYEDDDCDDDSDEDSDDEDDDANEDDSDDDSEEDSDADDDDSDDDDAPECVTDADCDEGEACLDGDCEDGNDNGGSGLTLTFGEVNLENSTVEVLLSNSEIVAGFQFVVTSANTDFLISGASGGLCDEFGLEVFVGDGSNVVLGFSEMGNTIPAGDGVLTVLSYSGAGAAEVCISESVVSGPSGVALDVAEEGCVDFASLQNGDMNNDGTTNVLDVVQLIGIILSNEDPTNAEIWLGDLNEDGIINVLDIIIIVNNIIGESAGRTTPIHQSKVEFGNETIRLTADGEIAGIQIKAAGDFQITSTNLPEGWILQAENGNIIMVSLDGSSVGQEVVLEYTGELMVINALVAGWNGNGILADTAPIPEAFTLEPAYPNPFNPKTQIQYSVPYTSDVQINVFNMRGQMVAELANGQVETGIHSAIWNAEEVVSGMYLIRIKAGEYTQSQKVMLLK